MKAPAESELTLPTPMRDWTDESGRPLRAALLRKVDEAGTAGEFRREDGGIFTVPVDRFSEADQPLIRKLFTQ